MVCVMIGGGRLAASIAATFTQSNGTISGTEWAAIGSVPLPLVVSNRAEANITGAANALTLYAAQHVTQLEGDNVRVGAYVYAPSATPNAAYTAGVFGRLDPATGNRIVAVPTSNSLAIVTVAGTTRTTRQTTTGLTIPAGSLIEIEPLGDVVNAYLNGASTPTVTWTGANAVVPGGTGKRAHGIETSSYKEFVGNSISGRSWAWDDYLARDV